MFNKGLIRDLEEALKRKKEGGNIRLDIEAAYKRYLEATTLLRAMPIEIKKAVILDEDEWENIDDGEFRDESEDRNFTREEIRSKVRELNDFIKTDPGLYKEICEEVELEKDRLKEAGEIHLQKNDLSWSRAQSIFLDLQMTLDELREILESTNYLSEQEKIEKKPPPQEPTTKDVRLWFDYYHECKKYGIKCTLKEVASKVNLSPNHIRHLHGLYKIENGIE